MLIVQRQAAGLVCSAPRFWRYLLNIGISSHDRDTAPFQFPSNGLISRFLAFSSLIRSFEAPSLTRRRKMHLLPWFLATLPPMAAASGQNCYWPNGDTATELMACSVASGNDAAACCYAFHYCMTNGLCLSPTEGTWYRGGCTDDQYQKTGCPQVCEKSMSTHSYLNHDYKKDLGNGWLTHLFSSTQLSCRRVGMR